MAHNYRLNPFTDTMESVSVTDYLQIPTTSPYTVRLSEVPLKTTPSTIVIKEVTSFAGETPTYGRTFTEVNVIPAAGQFEPDYYTSAGGDVNWNTGLIRFNPADAGVVLEISYSGTGTLVAVSYNNYPSWMADLGTGADGNYNPTASATLAAGTYNYESVNIPAGVTITTTGKVWIKCKGNVLLNGRINANGKGGAAGVGAGDYQSPGNGGAGNGGGAGGAGGSAGTSAGGAGGTRGPVYDIYNEPTAITGGGGGGGGAITTGGGAGGAGGAGGGAVIIIAKNIFGGGSITANGVNGSDSYYSGGGGGGGGGGIIVLGANLILIGSTTVTAGAKGHRTEREGTDGVAGSVGVIHKVVTR